VASLVSQEKQWGIEVLPEQRVQLTPTRFRIPDICVLSPGAPRENVVRHPPFLCIEILSKDDSMADIMERVEEYLAMGVPNVWVIEPLRRRGYHFTAEGMHEAKGGVHRTTDPDLAVPLGSIFE
jgi:Uma2 family endonuclease